MTVSEIRQAYLKFFKERGHAVVPSASLVPENDPTTLFTGSGMQPMLPYFLGEVHPLGTRITDSQKAFRAGDIEEVGDNRHTTFFEMLGNWSFGDYFKEEQIPWMFEFLTQVLQLDPARLYFTCYKGNDALGIPRDTEAAHLWQKEYTKLGIDTRIGENPERDGMQEGERIFYYDDKKNWWSRVGEPKNMTEGEPGGPDTEMFYDFGAELQLHEQSVWKDEPCHVNCDCGRFVEIGNNVFMEYVKRGEHFEKLPKPNVDFGAGLERIAMAVQKKNDIFYIDSMRPTVTALIEASGKPYEHEAYIKSFRVVTDHIRGAVFMIVDGVRPAPSEQGYVLRRLIRRAVRHMDVLGADISLADLVPHVVTEYRAVYKEVETMQEDIRVIISGEEEKFRKTLAAGLRKFDKLFFEFNSMEDKKAFSIGGEDFFDLYQTYGFPVELSIEEYTKRMVEAGYTPADDAMIEIWKQGVHEQMEKHRAQSKAGAEQKFKGGLADAGEQTTKLHTATHLLLAGLQKYLGDHVHQAGSNITAERARFDFTHPEKVSREILDKVEEYVNVAIQKNARMYTEQMNKDAAKKSGVEGSFWDKYPEIVSVYTVRDDEGVVYSRELCGGPHVTETGAMGTFKILKEEASSAGVRRIKATLT